MKRILIYFVILASLDFFTLDIIDETVIKYISTGALIISFFLVVILRSKNQKNIFEKKFKKNILLLITSVFISALSAYLFYSQPLETTFVTQRFMYFYVLYFLLHKFNLGANEVERIILYMALLFSIFYLLAIIYPDTLRSSIRIERDTVRVSLPGLLFLIMGFFISLFKVIKEGAKWHIILSILFFVNIIATGTRMVFLPLLLLLVLFLMKNLFVTRVKYSMLGFVAITIACIIMYDMIANLMNLLWDEVIYNEGNYGIRLIAIQMFFNNLFIHPLTYFMGNGIASDYSNYGKTILYLKNNFGIYQSDIGILGDYIRFGVLYLIGIGMILLKLISVKTNSYHKYIGYYILISCLTLSHFGVQSSIAALSCLLYIIDKYANRVNVN